MPNKNHIKTEGFYFCESDKAMINKIKSIHKAIIEGNVSGELHNPLKSRSFLSYKSLILSTYYVTKW